MTITSETDRVIARLRQEVCDLHAQLTRYELVIWTAGNVSARVPDRDLMVIKPSGADYDSLTADDMVVCDLHGNLVDGAPRPVVGHRRPRLRVPAHARGRGCRAHALHLRHRVGRPRRADPVRAHDDGRRVRRRHPGRPVRADRRRLDRPRHRGNPAGQQISRRADAQPRAVHHRPHRARRRQGGGHGRGRRTHRAHQPATRHGSRPSMRPTSPRCSSVTRTCTARPGRHTDTLQENQR